MELKISENTKYFIRVVLSALAVYVILKYLLVLFLPFLISCLLAHFLIPIVDYLKRRFDINRKLSAACLVLIISALIVVALVCIFKITLEQGSNLIKNYKYFGDSVDGMMYNICKKVERISGVSKNEIYEFIDNGIENIKNHESRNAFGKIMGESVGIIRFAAEWFVGIFTSMVAAFYMVSDVEKIREKRKSNIIISDLFKMGYQVYGVMSAYIKTQLIIMLCTSVICFFGLRLIHNPYALLLAIAIGAMDALPLFGIGVILVPWSLILYLQGSYVNGSIVFATFIICYVLREIMEPRLMGHKIGISALATIMSMYVGYKIFGISGVVLGPIGYVMIMALLQR